MTKDKFDKSFTKMTEELKTEMHKCLNKILTASKPLLIDLKVRQRDCELNALHIKSKHS